MEPVPPGVRRGEQAFWPSQAGNQATGSLAERTGKGQELRPGRRAPEEAAGRARPPGQHQGLGSPPEGRNRPDWVLEYV